MEFHQQLHLISNGNNRKRLTSLLLIPAMICCEVQLSGKIKTNKSEIPESPHPERSVTNTDYTLPKITIVSEEVVPTPAPI